MFFVADDVSKCRLERDYQSAEAFQSPMLLNTEMFVCLANLVRKHLHKSPLP